ncbi:MAG: c-type cytochrome, partial [Pirellulales bacterium]|nr:c-type cytochrome [Pirellulales bacterium]
AAWRQRLSAVAGAVDVEAGRRVFRHGKVGLCSNCHRHSGRGHVVGPDLTAASNTGDPDRLLRALLEPSRDVDPQFYPWTLLTEDGEVFTGIMLRDGGGGSEFFRDNQGRERKFLTSEIVERKPLTTSMMPDGLIDLMTDREIRDLLAFLDSVRYRNIRLQPRLR